jgi:hypothetical protein
MEVLSYSAKDRGCNTLDELVKKLQWAYNAEDVNRIPDDLTYAYETRR